MSDLVRSKQPFHFFTRLHLTELTGLKASNLTQLVEIMRDIPGSSIYHHTHRFLQMHQYLSPEPPNDFSYWVSGILNENVLGEKLASIDTVQFSTIRSLREKIVETIEKYLKNNPSAKLKFAGDGAEFYFIKSMSFVIPTSYRAHDLKEFAEILNRVTVGSIYYHIFESRLRLEKKTNDFSSWFEDSLGDKVLAGKIAKLDPYTYTLEELRSVIIKIIEARISS